MKEYLAGMVVTFGLILLALQFLAISLGAPGLGWSGLMTQWSWFFIPFMVIHALGGVVGSYLVALRRVGESFSPGVVIAVLTYVLEYVYQILLEGSFNGSLWAVICLVGGGVLGSMMAEARRMKR